MKENEIVDALHHLPTWRWKQVTFGHLIFGAGCICMLIVIALERAKHHFLPLVVILLVGSLLILTGSLCEIERMKQKRTEAKDAEDEAEFVAIFRSPSATKCHRSAKIVQARIETVLVELAKKLNEVSDKHKEYTPPNFPISEEEARIALQTLMELNTEVENAKENFERAQHSAQTRGYEVKVSHENYLSRSNAMPKED